MRNKYSLSVFPLLAGSLERNPGYKLNAELL